MLIRGLIFWFIIYYKIFNQWAEIAFNSSDKYYLLYRKNNLEYIVIEKIYYLINLIIYYVTNPWLEILHAIKF